MPHSPFTTAYLTRLELWNVGLQLPTPTIVTQRRAPHRSDATLSLCHNNFLIPIDSVLGYEGRIVYSTYVESKMGWGEHTPLQIYPPLARAALRGSNGTGTSSVARLLQLGCCTLQIY
jgi:hypothetical protein